jgi:transcriptional regulator with XRE-family HTH domain
MDFGSYIRQLRREKRLTQRELAEQLGVDFTYISKIENNKVENPPSEDLIRKMARILETGEEALLDLAGKFDHEALRRAAANVPEIGVLLRRIQDGSVTSEQVKTMIEIVEGPGNE